MTETVANPEHPVQSGESLQGIEARRYAQLMTVLMTVGIASGSVNVIPEMVLFLGQHHTFITQNTLLVNIASGLIGLFVSYHSSRRWHGYH